MVEALAGAPHRLGPADAAPGATAPRRNANMEARWARSRAGGGAAGRLLRLLGGGRRGAGEREVDLDRRASLLRLLEHAVDLLDELRDDGEAERPPRPALRFHADAVVADDEDAAVAALARLDLDRAAAPGREGVLEGVCQNLDGDEGERHRGVERNPHGVGLDDRPDAALLRPEGVGDLLRQAVEIFAQVDRGEVGRAVEQRVDAGHRADAPDRGLERVALIGPEVARPEAQEALHDLQVVLHPMIDLAQQHLALLGERLLGRGEEAGIEIAQRPRGREALGAHPPLHDVVEQEHGKDHRERQGEAGGRDDEQPAGRRRAPEGGEHVLRRHLRRGEEAAGPACRRPAQFRVCLPGDELVGGARAGEDAVALVDDDGQDARIVGLLAEDRLDRRGSGARDQHIARAAVADHRHVEEDRMIREQAGGSRQPRPDRRPARRGDRFHVVRRRRVGRVGPDRAERVDDLLAGLNVDEPDDRPLRHRGDHARGFAMELGQVRLVEARQRGDRLKDGDPLLDLGLDPLRQRRRSSLEVFLEIALRLRELLPDPDAGEQDQRNEQREHGGRDVIDGAKAGAVRGLAGPRAYARPACPLVRHRLTALHSRYSEGYSRTPGEAWRLSVSRSRERTLLGATPAPNRGSAPGAARRRAAHGRNIAALHGFFSGGPNVKKPLTRLIRSTAGERSMFKAPGGDWRLLADRRVAIMLALGFSSGLPLLLVLGTFSARLAFSDIDVKTIGLFSYLALPYSLKFLWSPVIDRYDLPVLAPWLGRRRAWMVLSQICVAAALTLMAFAEPGRHLALLGLGAFLVAFSAATQDVVIDGWRIEAVGTEQQGMMAATSNLGYRIALITAGAGTLVLAHWAGWTAAYP